MTKPRLLAVASHPIQYFVPLYQLLAQSPRLDFRVVYCREYGISPTYDKQFKQHIQWDTDLLGGYDYTFLRNISPVSSTFNPLHALNPGVIAEVFNGVDVIWINGLIYPTNWLALAAAKIKRAAIICRSELYPEVIAERDYKASLKRAFYRQSLKLVDGFLTIGARNRAAYAALGVPSAKMTDALYVVDVSRFQVTEAERQRRRARQRAAWGLTEADIVVLHLGKLTVRKHPEALLALDDAEHADRLTLVWVGAGEMEQALKARAVSLTRSKAVFAGLANQSEIPDVLWASDMFVFPSEREPWGLVLNEAMAAGLPAIVSDQVGAAVDLCIDGVTGYTFPANDLEALKARVDRLADDASLRVRMGDAAREHIMGWTPEITVRGIEQAVLSLVTGTDATRAD
jgi:glycosyltransferase involved in cell wall biosynthesis